MTTVSAYIDATPEQVFAVLANGWYYSGWVVGTSHMRAVEPAWPAVGSRLFHATGVWPVTVTDDTSVEDMVPNERLVMTARGRPFGEARVEVSLVPAGSGTHVTMTETLVSGPARWVDNRAVDALIQRRNVECLARLAAISEGRPGPDAARSRPVP